ncbi:hypothetical protein FM107_14125 [Sphingobacterium sp. JB170]|nr:hypothetical protein FM107_14125 [Sphingobacterium sp. JB170]
MNWEKVIKGDNILKKKEVSKEKLFANKFRQYIRNNGFTKLMLMA